MLLYVFRVIYVHAREAQYERRITMNRYELRDRFELRNYGTEIAREAFERNFKATKEKVTFTFNGWDGKSYDGESRKATVYRTTIEGFEDVRFIKVGKALCYIEEECQIVEKATGESHPEAFWLVDVQRRAN